MGLQRCLLGCTTSSCGCLAEVTCTRLLYAVGQGAAFLGGAFAWRVSLNTVQLRSCCAGALASATGNTGTTEQPSGFSTDLTALGSGKKQMLGVSLDRMADSVSGQTTVDPTGYLTSLANHKVRA